MAFDDLLSLEMGLELLNYTLKEYRMNLNIDKTKRMVLNFQGERYPSTLVNLDSQSIENVQYSSTLVAASIVNRQAPETRG